MEKSQHKNEKEGTVADCNSTIETSKEKQAINDIEKQKAPSVHSQANTAVEDSEHHPKKPKTLREKINVGARVFGIALAMLMVSLNTMAVGPALRTDLNRRRSQGWIEIAYISSLMGFRPSPEKYFDIFGRKGAFLFAIALFFIGYFIDSSATTINMLIVGRSIQALGCGGMTSVAYTIAPIRFRFIQHFMLMVISWLSIYLRSLIDDSFVDKLNWRWVFWLNVIFGGITCIMMVQQVQRNFPFLNRRIEI